jgi:hypothetical protein
MSNLTPTFNELLEQRDAPPAQRSFNVDNINNFLKEAYRIVRRTRPYSLETSC